MGREAEGIARDVRLLLLTDRSFLKDATKDLIFPLYLWHLFEIIFVDISNALSK